MSGEPGGKRNLETGFASEPTGSFLQARLEQPAKTHAPDREGLFAPLREKK